jgi:hypothetical protein
MPPCLATSDPVYCCACDTEFSRELLSVAFVTEYRECDRRRKPCGARPLPLNSHVARIISMRSEKQMIRIDAQGVVAAMTNASAFWDRSESMFKTSAMGMDSFAIHESISVPVDRPTLCPAPVPATAGRAINLRPKSFCEHDANYNRKAA